MPKLIHNFIAQSAQTQWQKKRKNKNLTAICEVVFTL